MTLEHMFPNDLFMLCRDTHQMEVRKDGSALCRACGVGKDEMGEDVCWGGDLFAHVTYITDEGVVKALKEWAFDACVRSRNEPPRKPRVPTVIPRG